jgi:N-acetylglutamate synthase
MNEIDQARSCEECLVNVWPAVSTLMMDGWAVRFANGYSSRANSASAIVPGARFTQELIAHVEALYRQEGLKPRVRVTPMADAGTAAMLLARGYRQLDESMTMIRSLALGDRLLCDPRVTLACKPESAWLQGISDRQEASKRSADHLHAIVSRIKLPAAFTSLQGQDEAQGFGLCVVDRDWAELGSIMIDAGHRGRGFGQALVESLLAFAAETDAMRAFLQVDLKNGPAIRLYERLGFQPLYRYNTMLFD